MNRFFQFIKLSTAHQRCRLYNQNLHFVLDGSFNCLLYVVDLFVISCLNVIDDDLCSESSSYGEVWNCFLDCFFDCTDGCYTVIIVAGTEAAHQNFVAANLVLVQRVVFGGIAGIFCKVFIAALFFIFFQIVSETGDCFLFSICQAVPASACCFAEHVSAFGSFLIVDGTGQVCYNFRCELYGQIVLTFEIVPAVNLFACGLREYLIHADWNLLAKLCGRNFKCESARILGFAILGYRRYGCSDCVLFFFFI